MRTFALYDSSKHPRKPCAWILYEPAKDAFSLELADWAAPKDVPLGLAAYAAEPEDGAGPRTVSPYWTKRWLETRIPPADRQNIDAVLQAHGLDEYYAPALLAHTKGRSVDDDFLVEEVPSRTYRTTSLAPEAESPQDIGMAISRARRAANLTQHQLAEATGLPQSFICAIEKGRKNPTVETLETLAEGCGRKLRIVLE